jgi:two-component system phosphate regulon sensor histidine kinase PhoR
MFRRLLAGFGFLLATLVLALVAAVGSLVEQQPLRLQLIVAVGASALVFAAATVLLCSWWNRQLKRSLRELTRGVEIIGAGNARVFLAANDELGLLGKTFNRISERLSARIAQLEADRQQLRAILSGMVEGVVALDSEQRILFANDRAGQLLEITGQAVVGRPLWEVVRQRSLIDVIRRALDSPEAQREEIKWTGAAARSLTVHAARLSGVPPHHVGGAVLVLHDTTELRRLERLRQEFVANVSHELKTPLSVIKVCVETLQDGAAEDPRHRDHFLGQIARQSDRLHMLILDLLSLARIESGDELFDFQVVPVSPLAEGLVERFRPRALARQQVLEVSGQPADAAVWADEEAVEQMLENLLDNALKYTPEHGRVHVGWHVQAAQVCIEVSDTGIGIPEADLARIFERFYRVDKARSREMGGTGLGLSIVKHLAQAMNGSVRATSRVGQGSTFQVCLPAARG